MIFLALVIISPVAVASPISLSDFSGSETVIGFDDLTSGTILTNQYSGSGVTFQNTSESTSISDGFPGDASSAPNVAFTLLNLGGSQEILFSTAVNKFGVFLAGSNGETFLMDVYDTNGLVESLGGANNAFLGVFSSTNIISIALRSSTNGFNFVMDDVRFESSVSAVPVPAAVWLFGTAMIGLIGFGKRKPRIAA